MEFVKTFPFKSKSLGKGGVTETDCDVRGLKSEAVYSVYRSQLLLFPENAFEEETKH